MKIATRQTTENDTLSAFDSTYAELVDELGAPPHLLLVFSSATHDIDGLSGHLGAAAPGVPVHGGTSCLGVMTEEGFCSEDGVGLGLWGIRDDDGGFGVGIASMGDDPKGAAVRATRDALEQADRVGELPELIWLTAAPGFEEDVIAGIVDVVGPNVPIFGGSTADNTVEGKWRQFTPGAVHSDAVVLSVWFPSGTVSFAFQSGYVPTETTWEVTACEGRCVATFDGQPAASAYNASADGVIDGAMEADGNVLAATTLAPLGRKIEWGDAPLYLLSHPHAVTEKDELSLFSTMSEGDKVTLMTGTREGLVTRAGEVAQFAMDFESWSPDEISGALVVYCGGCMLTVQDDVSRVASGLSETLDSKPFIGIFTFGEQGAFPDGINRHGNLMISAVLFSESDA